MSWNIANEKCLPSLSLFFPIITTAFSWVDKTVYIQLTNQFAHKFDKPDIWPETSWLWSSIAVTLFFRNSVPSCNVEKNQFWEAALLRIFAK